eukprot:574276_1
MGGFPKYFYLWQKTKEQSICLSCKQKMYLLAQINAPLMEEQCQRNIYVFMCCNAKCTKTNRGWNVMVHRGPSISTAMYAKQHKSHNNDDPYVDGTDHEIHKMIKHNNKTKSNRTTSSSLDTDSFWNTNLNSATAKPEQMDSEMQHKLNGLNDDFSRLMQMQNQLLNEVDKQSKASGKKKKKKKAANVNDCNQKAEAKKGSFIPFEITFYDETYYKNEKSKAVEGSGGTIQWKDKQINLKSLMDDEVGKDSTKDDEEDMLSDYLERISVDKKQCIRYCYGDRPLVPNKIDFDKIPQCKHCGHKKVFEFQIMSAALCYLEPKQIHHDWLTVLVFVCPMTCQQSDQQYVVVSTEK